MTTIIGAGGGKGGGNSARVPVEAKDSLRSKAFAKVIDLISEGEIGGLVDGLKSVYLDGTPIQNPDGTNNFTGAELTTRSGSQLQSYVPGFAAAENTIQVGVEVTAATSVTRQITNTNTNTVRVIIGIPNLSKQNLTNGDLNGTTVEYAIDLQSNGGGFVPQLLSSSEVTTGLTNVSPGRYASTDAVTKAIAIRVPAIMVTGGGHRMEYKLVSSGTWLTAGVTTVTNEAWDALTSMAKFKTPTLAFGQWEARIVTNGGAAIPATNVSATRFVGVESEKLTGKTTTRYQRSYEVQLTGSAPWDIRVRRITADSTSVALQNKTFFDTYTEVIEAKLRYPNSALVALKIDSSQFQNIPVRGYEVNLLLIKVPANYDPTTRAYTGNWDGTFKIAWSNNPAWCFYDLLTNERYGLGGLIDATQVDKWAMYSIGQYCDGMVDDGFGGTEPRFTCNFYLQTRAEAYKVLQDFASIFRGMAFWSTGAITAVQDAPSDPVALYTAANVIDGKFQYAGSGLKARHTVAMVTWNDPEDLYRAKVEYVEDAEGIARYGVQQTEITAVGCTSRGQANRVGKWLLFSERMETETVQFSVGLEGALVRPGSVIKVSDANRASARLGGRVSSSTTSTITVDRAPAVSVTGWTLYVTLSDGTVESRTVSGASGPVVAVAPAFSSAPTPQGIWILSGPSVEAQTFRVLAIAEDAETKNYGITALAHEPLKYAAIEEGLILQPRDITLLNDVPGTPTGLALSESLYTQQSQVRAKVNVGWLEVSGVYKYFVEWRKDEGNWVRLETQNTDIEILDITPGTFDIRVYSSNPAGLISGYVSGSLVALGKTAPPADVTGFDSVVDPSLGVTLTWAPVADIDVEVYEVRVGVSWSAGTLVGQVKGSTLKIGVIPTGSTTYWVSALDTSGVYSTAATSTVVTINAAPAPTVTSSFSGEAIVLSWGAVQGSLATDAYEIRYGASYAAGVSLGTIKGTTFRTTAAWSGARTFWVAALDIGGSTGTAGNTVASVSPPVSVTITQEVIDNNVLLRWTDARATLPLDYYELRRGATWAGATVIGRVSARFSAIFESSAGSFLYWVAATDLAGNVGTPANVSALVSQPPDYTLQYNLDSVFSGTATNFVPDAGNYLALVSPTETWQDHFTSRSWTTPQDQITAGYPIYAQPSQATGSYEETIDYGTVLAATKITATLSYSTVSGSTTVTPKISVRKLATDPWTDYSGVSSVFVTDFRYAKIRYDFASSGGDDLVTVSGLNVRFDVKLKNDAGVIAANSADSGGTTVTFNVSFVDVQSITVTPKGTAARIGIYDFVDVPNPTSFKVLLFDTAGNRVSGDASWSVKGV